MKRISLISNSSIQYYKYEAEINIDFGKTNKVYFHQPIGGFANASYWSSSQSSTSATANAISINFGTGVISNNLKTNSFYVRAIRKF
jgi:hypothetical protein